ncbi:HAD-IA family hydrolase [Enterovibrio sp. ZSDZ35]|uniref:phosphoglycolate phosphatase n=1 Tax=Enterovibrio qingdaonensis TaxID=2899818 RepID=A0ABT5QJB2_9GAMM|nr:HAD-IA family hydrolase [Enterovibrio sp. ZSDZ35]MDD1781082.1 HAD-IA family hydrolase [Enterovibrio sp. ZSDZ35]
MLMTTKVKAVIFELDGTLVDTAPDIRCAAEEMLADLNLPSLNAEHVSDWIGDGMDRLIHRILSRQIDGKVPDPIFRLGSALFLKAYQRREHQGSALFDGVLDCLRELTRRKMPLVIVTNQATSAANELLTALGIRHHFDLVLGRDAMQEPKPSPDGLLEAALLLDLNPEQLMMVGGSVNDVHASRNALCPVACVSYGYNYGVDICYAAPDIVFDSLSELPEFLDKKSATRRPRRTNKKRASLSKAEKEKR